MFEMETDLFNNELMCNLIRLDADFPKRAITLYLGDRNSTDMNGAIKFCERIIPMIQVIMVKSNNRPDVFYSKQNSEWVCMVESRNNKNE